MTEHRVYRHKRVVFGVNCSPFLLAAVIENLLSNVEEKDKPLADKVLKSLYVDNLVTSVDILEECQALKKGSTEIMAEAKMELREWEGGFEEKSGISPSIESGCGLDFGRTDSQGKAVTSVLGYRWNKLTDTLYCDLSLDHEPERITKRKILSYMQQVFDPIGFLCPTTIQPKLIFQQLWGDEVGWDEDLQPPVAKKFLQWYEQLPELEKIQIPRNTTNGNSSKSTWQLHTFCDASKDAYAAVVFLRTDNGAEVSVQLFMAKARVTPVKGPGKTERKQKSVSINRLELLSCFIGARLSDSVKKDISRKLMRNCYWSDSSTFLAWIRGNDEWGTFVGNRVKTICNITKADEWRHVPGDLNNADLPSRGCSPSQLLTSRWWEGPDWLKKPEKYWPSEDPSPIEHEVVAERRKSPPKVTNLLVTDGDTPWYWSTLTENVTIMAWILRFIKRIRRQSTNRGPLTVAEITDGELRLIRLVQLEAVPQHEARFEGLQIERREDGLIHVKTRLDFKEDTEGFRFPILLPHSNPLVSQIVRDVHIRNKHAGVQFVLGNLRERFWIVQGR